MKDVLKTILLTNLIHHLYEFLPIHVSRLRQRIMQAPYKLVIYGNIYAVGSTYKAIVFLLKFSLTRRICLESVPSYDSAACIRGLFRFFRRIGTLIYTKQQWHQFYIERDSAIYLFKIYQMEFYPACHALVRKSKYENNKMR